MSSVYDKRKIPQPYRNERGNYRNRQNHIPKCDDRCPLCSMAYLMSQKTTLHAVDSRYHVVCIHIFALRDLSRADDTRRGVDGHTRHLRQENKSEQVPMLPQMADKLIECRFDEGVPCGIQHHISGHNCDFTQSAHGSSKQEAQAIPT